LLPGDRTSACRPRGIHAEPITFGFKAAGWLAELERDRERLTRAREQLAVGKLSGAVDSCSSGDSRGCPGMSPAGAERPLWRPAICLALKPGCD
jgi:hypothetical protein